MSVYLTVNHTHLVFLLLFSSFGSNGYIIPRKVLHNILVSRLERQNIVMGKRVLTYIPGNRYVTVKCSTGDLITCDILVGADGVFSAVRQNLYEELDAKGFLPPKDSEDVVLSTVRLVGQTIPLDPEEFPAVKDENCHFVRIIGDDKPYSVSDICILMYLCFFQLALFRCCYCVYVFVVNSEQASY